MSYAISVPIIRVCEDENLLKQHLEELRRLDAVRVMLSIERYYISEEAKQRELDAVRSNCAFFKAHGLEVGAWIWAFALSEKM